MVIITDYYARVKVMAKAFSIEIKGLDKLQKKLDKLPKDVTDETDAYLQRSCQLIVREAAQNAPLDKGALKRSIDFTGARLSYVIFAKAKYAPYQEFGTGKGFKTFGSKGGDLQSYASRFKGGGKRQVDMRAQPFFFPAVFKQEDKIKKEYSQLMDKLLNK